MKNKSINITFLGDISFNDSYIEMYKEGVNPFKNIEPLLKEQDFVIGNLECLAKGEKGENELKKPRLTTTLETLNYLNTLNISAVGLAQNHIYDHLSDGFEKTTNFLNSNNIKYFGASLKQDEVNKPLIVEKNEIQIGFLNYVTHDTNPNLPKDANVFVNYFDIDRAIREIEELKNKVNVVVLFLHWGGRVEGGLFPDWQQPKIARKLIDAGADLIVGHHTHTIQPFEKYKGKYIFYSLGNFCFENYKFENNINYLHKRNRKCLILNISFADKSYKVNYSNWLNNTNNYSENKNYNYRIKIRNFYFKNFNKSKLFWNLYYLHKKKILPLCLYFQKSDLTFYQKVNGITKAVNKRIKKK